MTYATGTEAADRAKHAALQELARTPQRLTALYDILQALGADLDFKRSFSRCLKKLCAVCSAERGGIYLLENDSYRAVAVEGLPERRGSRLRFARDAEPFLTAERRRAPVIGGRAACLRGARSSLAAPLHDAGRHVGAVLLTAGRAERMNREHGLFVGLLTDKLAQALVASQEVQKLVRDARTDATTGLPNARASFRRLEQELSRAEREGAAVGVLFLDIDGLKPLNDRYGHAAGDKLLVGAARKLEKSLRSYDFVGRIGGDEFLAVLPGAAPGGLEKRIRALQREVSAVPVEVAPGVNVSAAVSVGAAFYPRDGATAEELLDASDRRMYADKQASRSAMFALQRAADPPPLRA